MRVFKTSGNTFDSVVHNQKHAFLGKPKDWSPGELVLISKNKRDCLHGERQIQYIMAIKNIRPMRIGESEKYWPGSEGRWRYLVELSDTKQLPRPFNLDEVLGGESKEYSSAVTFANLSAEHENKIRTHLRKLGVI